MANPHLRQTASGPPPFSASLEWGTGYEALLALSMFTGDERQDTYEAGKDVRDYTGEIVELMDPSVEYKGKKVPPVCVFSWGGFNFRGIVEKVTQNFLLFLSSGIPVRAVLIVAFKQFNYPAEQARGSPPGDPTKIRIVTDGETLNAIAAREYGDPSLWRVIADANADTISNPRVLRTGSPLVIPALT